MNDYAQMEEDLRIEEEQAKELIKYRDALMRLQQNKDFKLIMSEGYFKNEASRLVLLRADPSIQEDPKIVRSIDDKIIAVGELRQYFITTLARGHQAEESLKEAREAFKDMENGE